MRGNKIISGGLSSVTCNGTESLNFAVEFGVTHREEGTHTKGTPHRKMSVGELASKCQLREAH